MALNSAITCEGAEIGRAQALQAEAARVPASSDMNPVLLKTAGKSGMQVILDGKVQATMTARDYYAAKKDIWPRIASAYDRLAQQHQLIIIEGAGSPAEINLLDVDIVNMAMAEYARAPVLLLGDIEKGGVFASLFGTIALLEDRSAAVKGFIINKFRGDRSILEPGLRMIAEKTGLPVIGVLPHLSETGLPEEDGLALSRNTGMLPHNGNPIRIVIVRHASISNFTDFDPLRMEPDVSLVYSGDARDLLAADLIIVPGTKNTVADLLALQANGMAEGIRVAHASGKRIIGICGGYQMLGRVIRDPKHVESVHGEVGGLGLLPIETDFTASKTTAHSSARIVATDFFPELGGAALDGYEIHMGESSGGGIFEVERRSGAVLQRLPDGARNGSCWGTYLHGIFDNDEFRRAVINEVRGTKGIAPHFSGVDYRNERNKSIDRLADTVREHCDLDAIRRIIAA